MTESGPTFMQISSEYPPNFDAIAAVFPAARQRGVLFTYGQTLHNPAGRHLTAAFLRHEEVHADQQKVIGADEWWDRYLKDTLFRYQQERTAHIVEYMNALIDGNRADRRSARQAIAKRLSGPLYGHMITFSEAMKVLKHEERKFR